MDGAAPDIAKPLSGAVNAPPFVPSRNSTSRPDESWRKFESNYPQATFQTQLKRSRPSRQLFMNEAIRQSLLNRNRLTYSRLDPNDHNYSTVPVSIHRERFHSLMPFDTTSSTATSSLFGFPTSVYKATQTKTGQVVVIRRVHGCVVSVDAAKLALEPWQVLRGHPNLVTVLDVFVTKDFGDSGSLCVVYELCPLAVTLRDHYLIGLSPIFADTLWSIFVQLVSAVATIHSVGLACRTVDPRSVLLLDSSAVAPSVRIKLNSCGIKDAIRPTNRNSLADLQAQDVKSIGQIILSLATAKPFSEIPEVTTAVKFVSIQFGKDLAGALRMMLAGERRPTIFDVSRVIHHRSVHELQMAYAATDMLEYDLSQELQNGRLFRLLAKLGYICERPEFNSDPHWSEHGERYPIKLLRDYLFHQVDDNGNPVIDLALLVHCLNKLDAGVSEKTILSSRDESTLLVLGFDDLKKCIDSAFSELSVKKVTAQRQSPEITETSPTATSASAALNVHAPHFTVP